MARQVFRALAAFATSAVLTLGFAPGAPANAQLPSAGHPAVAAAAQAKDYCGPADTNSVTVVVDFSGAGGGIDIRCSSGSTGQQALANAFGYSEIASQPGFVCQIEGAPAGDCQNTPPGSAYWSYWQAAPGGGWAYSSRGFGSSRVKPGGFEGWAFGSGGAPGIDPVFPVAAAPEPPTAVPEQPAPEPAAPQPEQPAAEPPAAEPPAAEPPAAEPAAAAGTLDVATADGAPLDTTTESAAGADPAVEAAAAAAAAEAAAQVSAAQATKAATAAGTSSSASDSGLSSDTAAISSATTSAGDLAALSSTESTTGSTTWFSVVALLAVVSLGTAAVVVARRRRTAGDDQVG